ncbi:MAG: hypothetical protein ACE5LC_05680 [Candidatus Aminicenantales bacterium]
MKKAVSLTLATLFIISSLLIFAESSYADVDKCQDEYEKCRTQALNSGAGVIKMSLMLTRCLFIFIGCLFEALFLLK